MISNNINKMEVYSVLLISVDSCNDTMIKGIFTSFEKAKECIMDLIEPMIEDQDISWYRPHGSKTLKSFELDLLENWETKPFDIFQIKKPTEVHLNG